MIVRNGNRVNRGRTAIIEIELDCGYELFIFQGALTEFDILIKYKNNLSRLRTPKHIHWVVDMLMKYQTQRTIAQEFVQEIQGLWGKTKPLSNNTFQALESFAGQVNALFLSNIKQKFTVLSRYGEYDVEFAYFLISFLILQEKTNMPNAFMFSNIITDLLKTNIDIFKIVSTATHNGR
ncbi:MAG: hypothetical protein FWE53_02835 [Firmicutes bacterium]|nr:hypothetical protein [Bacillota bacterium]